MARRADKRRAYVLTFSGTRARKFAASLRQARQDARYWISYGAMKVCINKRLPSGRLHQVQCLSRSGGR